MTAKEARINSDKVTESLWPLEKVKSEIKKRSDEGRFGVKFVKVLSTEVVKHLRSEGYIITIGLDNTTSVLWHTLA